MHHLEARFDFALVREQLKSLNVAGMPPFSDFEFLKQVFTEGERGEKLRREELITEEQFQRFLAEGAIGSHLETLQRRGGFKGFNQKSVSAIIAADSLWGEHPRPFFGTALLSDSPTHKKANLICSEESNHRIA
jgi:hypothetical protein